MTPKEKADQLINNFAEHTDIHNNVGSIDHKLWNKRNKDCAKLLVNEIRAEYAGYRVKPYLTLEYAFNLKEYWDDVLKELELW